MTFREKFIASAKAALVWDALSAADAIAVGFSGGADSTVLLALLLECFPDKDIRAIHINHMIRGEAADRDEEHCRRFCAERGVAFEARRVDVPALAAERRIGVEQAAREARYAVFHDFLSALGERAILCTAHNADDNLETVIFNLIRGSGTRGMGGVAPRRGRILRPMLSLSSAEIREYAASAALPFVVDETNADVRYTRNAIRGEVIPILRRLAPECAKSAAAGSALVRRDDEYLRSLASDAVASREQVPLADLRALDDAVLSRALIEMYTAARGERTDFSSVHIADCIALIRASGHGEVCLPGAISMLADCGAVRFAPTVRGREAIEFSFTIFHAGEALSDTKYYDFPALGFRVAVGGAKNGAAPPFGDEKLISGANIYKKFIYMTIGFDKIKGSIAARNRLPGDKLTLRGVDRKLKKLLCDEKIPDRDRLPVFCDDDGVLFVPGVGARDGAAAKDGLTIAVWR